VNLPEVVSLIIGVLGVAGLVFTALKYNRDDTTAVLGQQNTIVSEMKTLMDELRAENTRLRERIRELEPG
jgi:cell division protein FtsB